MSDSHMTRLSNPFLTKDGDADFGIHTDGRGNVDLRAASATPTAPISDPLAALDVSQPSEPGFAAAFQDASAEVFAPGSGLMEADTGSEFQANTYTSGTQARPALDIDADGDFVVVWHSNLQDGANNGIFGQRFNASGVPQGSEFQVNSYTSSSQQNPDVAMDDDGDFVVVWDSAGNQDGNLTGVFGQRYNASGTAQGSEFRINTFTSNTQASARIAMDADGDFVVTWGSNNQDGGGYGVYFQRFNASGTAQGAETQVNIYTTGTQGTSRVAMDDDGDFVIVWTSANNQDGDSNGIYARRYNASGVPQSAEIPVNTYTTNNQTNPVVAMDDVGNFVVAWSSNGQDGANNGIYAQRYNASGVAQGTEFRVNTYTTNIQASPSIDMNDDGDFLVTWQSNTQDGDNYGVFGQYYTASGVAKGAEFQINTTTSSAQIRTSVKMDADGDFIVTWDSSGDQDGNGIGIFGQMMSAPVSATLTNLDGDSVALAASGQFTALDSGTAVAVTSTTLSDADWDGATVSVTRVRAGVADGGTNDAYSFLSSSLFSVDDTGGDFGGFTAGTLDEGIAGHINVTGVLIATTGGLAFARYYYTYATGVLLIRFGNTGAGDASLTGLPSKALVTDLLAHIGYGSSMPYGNAVIRITFDDTADTLTADVTVTSSTIHVDQTTDDAQGDTADGYSLREALARSVAQAGSDTVTLSSGTHTLATTAATLGGGDTLSALGSATIAASGGGGLAFAGGATVNVASGETLTLSAGLSGTSGLTKTGAGTLTLGSTANEAGLSGGVTVSAGTLAVADDDALAAGTVTLAASTTLSVTGATTIDNAVALTGAAMVANSSAVTLSGNFTGSSELTKTGAGTLTLSGSNVSMSGGLTVSAGTVVVAGDSNLVGGTVTLSQDTMLLVTAAATIDNAVALTGAATINNSATVTLSGNLTGSGELTKSGAGTLTLSGSNSGMSGGLTISGGTVAVASDENLVAGEVTLAAATVLAVTGATTIDNNININGSAKIDNSEAVTLSGVLADAPDLNGSPAESGLTKSGNGTLTLTGNNSGATGGLAIEAGTVAVAGDQNLVTGEVTVAAGATLSVTGATSINNDITLADTSLVDVQAAVTLSGNLSGTLTKTGTGALTLTGTGNEQTLTGDVMVAAGTLVVADDDALAAGTVTLADSTTFSLTGATDIDNGIAVDGDATLSVATGVNATLSGTLTGDDDLTKTGSGTLTLNGYAAGMTGGLIVSSGTLAVASDNALVGGIVTLDTHTALSVTSAATIDNAIILIGPADIRTSAAVTLSGLLQTTSTLSKVGSGILTLTNTGNEANMLGDIEVSEGTLSVANDDALGGGDLIVAEGTTLSVTGATTIDNDVALTGAATFSNSAAVTLSGNLTGSSVLTKAGSATLTLSGSNSAMSGGLTISAGTVAVAADSNLVGGTVTLAADTTLSVTSTASVDNALALTGAATVSAGTGVTATLSGTVTGSSDLTKAGAGTLTLSGSNSGMSGGLTISAGSVAVAGDSNLVGGTVTLAADTTLAVTGTTTIDNAVALTGAATFSNSSAVTLSGTLTGSSTLTKAGSATLTLTGSNSSMSGGLTISAGTVAVAADSNLVGGTVTLAADTTLSVTSTATIDNAVALSGAATFTNSAAVTLSGDLTGSSDLTKNGAGTLTLSGSNSAMSGGLTVSAGAVAVGDDANLVGGTVALAGGTTLSVTGATTIDNAVALSGAATVSNGLAATLSGNVSGSSTLTKSGAGTLNLSGSNSAMSGDLTISAGTVAVSADSNLVGGTVRLSQGTTLSVTGATTIDNAVVLTGSTTISAGAAVTLSGNLTGASSPGGGLTGAPVSDSLIKTGSGTLTLSGSNSGVTGGLTISAGAVSVSADSNLLGGAVSLAAGTTLAVTGATTIDNAIALTGAATFNNSAAVTLSGNLTGSSTLTKAGSSTLTLTGSNSSMSGGLVISAGRVAIAADSNLVGGTVTLAADTSLSVTSTGTINNAVSLTGAASILAGSGVTATFSGALSGASDLTKAGAGTLILTGNSTGMTGGLSVSTGTLQVDAIYANTGDVMVYATLQGSGTIGGAVTVEVYGSIGAGTATAAGLLTLGDGLDIDEGGTFSVDLNGTTAGSGYDQIAVTGAVKLTDALLDLDLGFSAQIGDSFVLIANDDDDAITGTLNELAEGALITIDDTVLQLSYIGGDGNDLTLTVIDPSPVFTSDATAEFAENATGTVYQAAATVPVDADIVWSLSGDDAALFEIDEDTGAVTFLDAPDYEAPQDDGENNVYNIIVTATVGSYATPKAVAITVTDIGEALIGTEAADNLTATGTIRRVEGLGADDTLTGSAGNDVLVGGAGTDRMDGEAGTDTLIGGADSDIYYLDDGTDTVTEDEDGGDGDYVVLTGATTSYTLAAHVEHLYVSSTVNGVFSGNALNNVLVAQNDALATLMGGAGNDTYVLFDDLDTVVEADGGGTDTVAVEFTYTLGAFVENLILIGTDDIYGTGNGLANILEGNSGANRLDGKAGADTMYGGAEDDVYIVDNTNDIASETSTTGHDDGGLDTVRASVSYTLDSYIEALVLTGTAGNNATGNAQSNYLVGNAGDNVLDGRGGVDIMTGGAGNDTYYVNVTTDSAIEYNGGGTDEVVASATFTLDANLENLTLYSSGTNAFDGTGNAAANVIQGSRGSNQLSGLDGNDLIRGGEGNDALDGGVGADTLYGGADSDTYYIDNIGDVVSEQTVTGVNDTGNDLVISTISHTLGTYFERLTLIGDEHIDAIGNSQNNILTGNRCNNTLDGGTGADSLLGGAGDDLYMVDNAGDTVTEALGEGTDSVFTYVTFTLSANVEMLHLEGDDDLNGYGNDGNNVLYGNAGSNRLDGKGGIDYMFGGDGDDVYIVDHVEDVAQEDFYLGHDEGGFDTVRTSVTYTLGNFIENLRMTGSDNINGTGNSLANYLYGNAGNNVLDGSYGGDIMVGGLGNDTYYVNIGTDEVIEEVLGGTDKVVSQVSYTLLDNFENLELASWGTAAINATGNSGANVITGGRGSNILSGLAGNDTLSGGDGNDTLDGGDGADSMAGGSGSDVYYIVDAGDVIAEDAASGTDTVVTLYSYTLLTNFERLTLNGSGNINGTGNGVGNILTGNAGNNNLDGGTGADTISGGAGTDRILGATGNDNLTGGDSADTFVFAKTGSGTDHITDFAAGIDHLAFTAMEFGISSLSAAQFTSNSTGTAVGNTGQFVYNTTTHTLVWDNNGTGSGGITLTVIFDTNVTLSRSDFVFE